MLIAWNQRANYVACISVSLENGKITRKEMLKLYSCDYGHYDMEKFRQDANFEGIDTETLTGGI